MVMNHDFAEICNKILPDALMDLMIKEDLKRDKLFWFFDQGEQLTDYLRFLISRLSIATAE